MRTTFAVRNRAAAASCFSVAATLAQAAVFVGVASDRDGQSLPNVVMALKPVGRHSATAPTQITVTQEGAGFQALHLRHPCRLQRGVRQSRHGGAPHQSHSRAANRSRSPCTSPATRHRRSRFDKEGAIVAYCILHDWMRAYVYVADTPWTAISGDNGLARIENVAPGDYELTAWHPDLRQFKPPLTSKITVGASGTTQTTVKFDFKPRPIRKAPGLPTAKWR